MLKKLIKYEFKATARLLLPIYILLIIIALINRTHFSIDLFKGKSISTVGDASRSILFATYITVMIAVFVITYFIISQRIYKNLLGYEGYLMNTIPVKVSTILNSKIIIGIFWIFIGVITSLISIFILKSDESSIKEIKGSLIESISFLQNKLGIDLYIVLIELFIVIVLQLISSLIIITCSICIGHLFIEKRILASFLSYICITLINSSVEFTFQLIFSGDFLEKNVVIYEMSNLLVYIPDIKKVLIFTIIMNIAIVITYYLLSKVIIEKKLNLQ